MTPALTILSAWLLFGGTHLLLSSSGLRERLASRVSARAYTLLFLAVAIAGMSLLIFSVARFGHLGLPGPGWGRTGPLSWGFRGLAFAGAILMVAGLLNYPRSPMAALGRRLRGTGKGRKPLAAPTHVERLTRHPFFVGLIVVMGTHALMADTLAQSVYFLGFVVTAAIGIPLQDRKLRARWKSVYEDYEAQTSALPGRRPEVEPPVAKQQWMLWSVAVLLVTGLFVGAHGFWAAGNGAVFSGFILAFGALASLAALWRG